MSEEFDINSTYVGIFGVAPVGGGCVALWMVVGVNELVIRF